MSAATRSISNAGRRRGPRAGVIGTSCLTFSGPSRGRRGATPGAAGRGRVSPASGASETRPANAYLKPAMRRANLEVRTHALVTRILFEGTRAVGVRYAQGGLEHDVMADREVILS